MVGKRRGRHPRHDLDAKKVAALIRKAKPGRYFDGEGLHLYIIRGGTASWVLRIMAAGRRRDMGLGSVDVVSLAEARERARCARAIAKAGGDPLEKKRQQRSTPTFEDIARAVHTDHSPSWSNEKHTAQWLSTLETYAFPDLGRVRVDQIGVPEVLKTLLPIWLSKPETARRVRQRIKTVLDVARAEGYRIGENPIGPVLAKALPKQPKASGHHPAMPYAEVPAFFARLAGEDVTRLALQFLILTAARTGEVLGMRRDEIDLEGRVWTIPANRMKAGREHRIPLSGPAVGNARKAMSMFSEVLVFPGSRAGRPLSNMSLLMLCRRMEAGAVPHGFRSSFRDWAAEETSAPAEVAEMALAHVIGNKTEAAYRRGDLFEKRRRLMDGWASFVCGMGASYL